MKPRCLRVFGTIAIMGWNNLYYRSWHDQGIDVRWHGRLPRFGFKHVVVEFHGNFEVTTSLVLVKSR